MNTNLNGIISRASRMMTGNVDKTNIFTRLAVREPRLKENLRTILDHLKNNPGNATQCAHLLMGKTSEVPDGLEKIGMVGVVSPDVEKVLSELIHTTTSKLFPRKEDQNKTIEKLQFVYDNLPASTAKKESLPGVVLSKWNETKTDAKSAIAAYIKTKLITQDNETLLKNLTEAIRVTTTCTNKGLPLTEASYKALGLNVSEGAKQILNDQGTNLSMLATHKNYASQFFNAQTTRMQELLKECSIIINNGQKHEVNDNNKLPTKTKLTEPHAADVLHTVDKSNEELAQQIMTQFDKKNEYIYHVDETLINSFHQLAQHFTTSDELIKFVKDNELEQPLLVFTYQYIDHQNKNFNVIKDAQGKPIENKVLQEAQRILREENYRAQNEENQKPDNIIKQRKEIPLLIDKGNITDGPNQLEDFNQIILNSFGSTVQTPDGKFNAAVRFAESITTKDEFIKNSSNIAYGYSKITYMEHYLNQKRHFLKLIGYEINDEEVTIKNPPILTDSKLSKNVMDAINAIRNKT